MYAQPAVTDAHKGFSLNKIIFNSKKLNKKNLFEFRLTFPIFYNNIYRQRKLI